MDRPKDITANIVSPFARYIAERDYFVRTPEGKLKEKSMEDFFWRLAGFSSKDPQECGDVYELLCKQKFLFNTPYCYNAGSAHPLLFACYVGSLASDSMDTILGEAMKAGRVYKLGAGYGLNFGELRPRNEKVSTNMGTSSGPVSFMKIFDAVGDVVKSGGRRRAAFMGMMFDNHPDVMEFVHAKDNGGALSNMNISVAVSDDTMKKAINDQEIDLVFPNKYNNGDPNRKQKSYGKMKAKKLVDDIAQSAWTTGDPGVFFIDRANRDNTHMNTIGHIVCTNPCIIGSSKVAVADGRDYVTIKELSESGASVPVYGYSREERKNVIRWAHHPRLTGVKKEVWKVLLDNGKEVIATPDHKFILRDGAEIELKDLKSGDSLMPFIKRVIQDPTHSTDYKVVNLNNGVVKGEHILFAEFMHGRSLTDLEVVHHRDFDGLNNSWSNLGVMDEVEHKRYHRSVNMTPDNPKWEWWRSLTLDQQKEYRKKKYGNPGPKNGRYGNPLSMKMREVIRQKVLARCTDPKYREMLSLVQKKGFEDHPERRERLSLLARERGKSHWVTHTFKCEACGKEFSTYTKKSRLNLSRRFCSSRCSCGVSMRKHFAAHPETKDRISRALSVICIRDHDRMVHSAEIRAQTIALRLGKYLYDQGKFPSTPQEWDAFDDEAKLKIKRNVGLMKWITSNSIGKRFKDWTEFKEMAAEYNHKVVSVSFYGYEDVYDLTVEDIHNYALESGVVVHNCGEISLGAWTSCNLGSISLVGCISADEKDINWAELKRVVRIAHSALDRNIDLNYWTDSVIEDHTKRIRPVGLGFTGFAEVLFKMGIPYDSDRAVTLAEDIMHLVVRVSFETSLERAKTLGAFPDFEKNKDLILALLNRYHEQAIERWGPGHIEDKNWSKIIEGVKKHGLRNHSVTMLAPTGTISIVLDSGTYSLEPAYRLAYFKNLVGDKTVDVRNPSTVKKLEELGLNTDAIWKKIQEHDGSIQKVEEVPESVRDVFKVATDIHYQDRIKLQAAVQKWTTFSISSTINLPSSTTWEEIRDIYILAWKSGLKGVTVFRDGCKKFETQPMTSKKSTNSDSPGVWKRPKTLTAHVQRMRTPEGNTYITTSEDQGRLKEIFANVGRSGSAITAMTEAIGKLSSVALQHGVSEKLIAKALTGIRGGDPVTDKLDDSDEKPVVILSIPDAIGKLVYRRYVDNGKKVKLGGTECPVCHRDTLHPQETCWFCDACTYSRCL
jgi:ribonucleotide reductase alpha subunit